MQRFEGQVQLVLYPFALNPTSEWRRKLPGVLVNRASSGNFTTMLYGVKSYGIA